MLLLYLIIKVLDYTPIRYSSSGIELDIASLEYQVRTLIFSFSLHCTLLAMGIMGGPDQGAAESRRARS